MRKKSFGMLAFVALISIVMITSKLAEASITGTPLWTNPTRRNYSDGYYGAVNVAYDQGATAVLLVMIRNNRGIDAYFNVRVKMDWATSNATSADVMIKDGDTYAFEVQIPIPSSVSNLYAHTYTIYSMYRPGPGNDWTTDDVDFGSGFVVYSPDQSAANLLIMELNAYPAYSFAPFLSSAKAKELITNASLERNLGDQSYARADFTGARAHYQNALDNTGEAFAADTDYLSGFESAVVGLVSAGQSFLSFQGWAYLVAAIGFLFMGIGVIVYLIRRSKPTAPT